MEVAAWSNLLIADCLLLPGHFRREAGGRLSLHFAAALLLIGGWSWGILSHKFPQLGCSVDKDHLFFPYRTIILTFGIILLIMHGLPVPLMHTVNINSHIFGEDSPQPKQKLSINMVRMLTDRKRYQPSSRKIIVTRYHNPYKNDFKKGQAEDRVFSRTVVQKQAVRSSKNIMESLDVKKGSKATTQGKEKMQSIAIDYSQHVGIKSRTKRPTLFLHESKNQTLRAQSSSKQRSPLNATQCRLRSNASSHKKHISDNFPNSNNQQQTCSIDEHTTIYQEHEENKAVNPYTHEKYTYIQHKKRDELSQLRKNSRLRYGGNIVGSYRVATMALSPQRERRKVSVLVPSSCKVNVGVVGTIGAQTEEEGKVAVNWEKLEVEAPSPSPWEWGHMAEPASKDFIS